MRSTGSDRMAVRLARAPLVGRRRRRRRATAARRALPTGYPVASPRRARRSVGRARADPCAWSISEWLDGTIPRPGDRSRTRGSSHAIWRSSSTTLARDRPRRVDCAGSRLLARARRQRRPPLGVAQLPGLADVEAVTRRVGRCARRAPEWTGAACRAPWRPPSRATVLRRNGQLGGVIDWSHVDR